MVGPARSLGAGPLCRSPAGTCSLQATRPAAGLPSPGPGGLLPRRLAAWPLGT